MQVAGSKGEAEMRVRRQTGAPLGWTDPAGQSRPHGYHHKSQVLLILGILVAIPSGAPALQRQLPPPPLPVDPTPLNELLVGDERLLLENASQPKKQVEVCLDLSTVHLSAAQAAIRNNDYRATERELDIYNKAVAQALSVALAQEKGRRSLAKKIEQQLLKYLRTLEIIERLFPPDLIGFAEAATRQTKEVRVRALNTAFDSGDVLRDPYKKEPAGKIAPITESRKMLFAERAIAGAGRLQRSAPTIPGDYLNEEEDDHVREAQEADQRVKVFMKIAERRLLAITGTGPAPNDKKSQKKAEEEEREWGPLPKVSTAELLKHYARALEEAISKLEDAHEHNPKSSAIPKALTILRDSTDRHLQTLRSIETSLKDNSEREALRTAIAQAEWANKGAREGLKEKQSNN